MLKKLSALCVSSSLLLASAGAMAEGWGDNTGYKSKKIKAVATTGSNHRLGEPLWYLGPMLKGSFEFVFGHNEEGSEAIPLTTDSPMDTIVATGIDPDFLAELGLPADYIEDKFLNVPFHNVQLIVNPETAERAFVPNEMDAPGFGVTHGYPNKPITLKRWLKAKAEGRIQCFSNGTAKIRFKAKNLVPNGLYTLWGLYGFDTDGDGLQDVLEPAPYGGVPNAIVADGKGRASYSRRLGACPMDDPHLKYIDVVYHPDGATYGGTVDILLPGWPKFAVANTHFEFPVNVEPLED